MLLERFEVSAAAKKVLVMEEDWVLIYPRELAVVSLQDKIGADQHYCQ